MQKSLFKNFKALVGFLVFSGWMTTSALFAAEKKPSSNIAGGDLTGTYPNPDLAEGVVGSPELADIPGLPVDDVYNPVIKVDADGRVINLSAGPALIDSNGHLKIPSRTAPSVVCSTSNVPAVDPSGTDNAGRFFVSSPAVGDPVGANGGALNCGVIFATPYDAAPACIASAEKGPVFVETTRYQMKLSRGIGTDPAGFFVLEQVHYLCFAL